MSAPEITLDDFSIDDTGLASATIFVEMHGQTLDLAKGSLLQRYNGTAWLTSLQPLGEHHLVPGSFVHTFTWQMASPGWCAFYIKLTNANGIASEWCNPDDIAWDGAVADPCEGVVCEDFCSEGALFSTKCRSGECITDALIERHSPLCEQPLCYGVSCPPRCEGPDLYSQHCVDGVCVDHPGYSRNHPHCVEGGIHFAVGDAIRHKTDSQWYGTITEYDLNTYQVSKVDGLPWQFPIRNQGNYELIAPARGWTIEFQELIPGITPPRIPLLIEGFESIPLLPGWIVRGASGNILNEGIRLPTLTDIIG